VAWWLGASSYGASVNCFTHGWGHLGLQVRPPAHPLANEGAKMTKDSTKGELHKDIAMKDELRDDQLDTVTGGMTAPQSTDQLTKMLQQILSQVVGRP
jgi:hypothetical protein